MECYFESFFRNMHVNESLSHNPELENQPLSLAAQTAEEKLENLHVLRVIYSVIEFSFPHVKNLGLIELQKIIIGYLGNNFDAIFKKEANNKNLVSNSMNLSLYHRAILDVLAKKEKTMSADGDKQRERGVIANLCQEIKKTKTLIGIEYTLRAFAKNEPKELYKNRFYKAYSMLTMKESLAGYLDKTADKLTAFYDCSPKL